MDVPSPKTIRHLDDKFRIREPKARGEHSSNMFTVHFERLGALPLNGDISVKKDIKQSLARIKDCFDMERIEAERFINVIKSIQEPKPAEPPVNALWKKFEDALRLT